MIRLRYGWLLAVAAGLGLAVAFPPIGWWPAAIVAVSLLTAACVGQRVRHGWWLGALCGLVFFAVLLRWLSVVGVDAWLGLVGYSALWLGLTGAATAAVTRLPGWPVWVALVWVAQEAVRDRIPLGGWPWGRLGFSQAEAPWLPAAWWGGVPLLTLCVAFSGAVLTWGVRRVVAGGVSGHSTGRRATGVAVAAGAVVAPWLVAVAPAGWGPDVGTTTVAVVQGDVPATGLGFAMRGQRRAVLDNHVRQTLLLAEQVAAGQVAQPELVIWPENASDLDPLADPSAAAAISAAARAISAPILVGAVLTNPADPTTVRNVSLVWDPQTGPGPLYVKQHPVPFGEFVPFRDVLTRFIGRFELVPRDFVAGDTPGVLDMAGVPVGAVICFEVAYDDVVRGTVAAGAQLLAVQTNNATYTGGGQSEQQVAMARIRSVEFGRSTVVAATNGVSAQYQPDGTLVGELPERSAGWLVAELPLRDHASPAQLLAGWPELAAGLLALLVVVAGLRRPAGDGSHYAA